MAKNKEPDAEPGCKQQYIEAAQVLWKNYVLGSEPVIFNIDTSVLVPFGKMSGCVCFDPVLS